MHIVFLVDARAHAGCACSSYKDVSFRSKGDSSVDGEGGDGPALWESLEKYPECVCVAVIRTLVAIGAADKGRLHWRCVRFVHCRAFLS